MFRENGGALMPHRLHDGLVSTLLGIEITALRRTCAACAVDREQGQGEVLGGGE